MIDGNKQISKEKKRRGDNVDVTDRRIVLVDGPAVPADLPAGGARSHADAAHLAHGVLELVEEVSLPGEAVDHAGGAAVGEQRGVGGEEAAAQLEVDVVVRVEPRGAAGVHGHRGHVVGRRG